MFEVILNIEGQEVTVSVDMGAVKGERGWYYTPAVDSNGVLTWSNNGGLENPDPANIRGPVGKGFQILGTFETYDELLVIENPQNGDFYNVGETHPYELYMWDEASGTFISQGVLEGPTGPQGDKGSKGDRGLKGTTFVPAITDGVMSWSNTEGEENPAPVDLVQELELNNKVDKVSGKQLSTNDYTTEEKQKLAGIEAGANNYVLPQTLPSSMITDIPALAVENDTVAVFKSTAGSMGTLTASEAREALGVAEIRTATASLPMAGWLATEPHTQTVSVTGVTAASVVIVTADPSDAAAFAAWNDAGVYCSAQAEGSLTFTATEVPAADVAANVLIVEVRS